MRLEEKVILVVGASQGIARALVLQLSASKNSFFLTARNSNELKAIQSEVQKNGSECETMVADALDSEKAKKVIDTAVQAFSKIDIALINAGGAWPVEIDRADPRESRQIFEMNTAPVLNYFFPIVEQMMKQPEGGIIAQTNSLAGFQGLPFSAAYSGSKASMRIFFDGARIELKKHKIRLVTLCPGFVSTRAHDKGEAPTPFIISPEKAARYMRKAISREKKQKTFPLPLAFATFMGRFTPRFLSEFILSRQKLNR